MAKKKNKGPKINSLDEFEDFFGQVLAEQDEASWDDFIGHIREIVDEKYEVNNKNMQLDDMFWNMMTSMGDGGAHVTFESIGGETGIKNLVADAHERSLQFDRMIGNSLDSKGMFVYRHKGRDALPAERYLEFPRQKGSLTVLGAGGQGFVVYGKLKSLPYDVLEKFYTLLISRGGIEEKNESRSVTELLKGLRTNKEKATKLRSAINREWQKLYEHDGYVFEPAKHFGKDVAVKVFPQKPLSSIGGFEKEGKFIGWPSPHIMPILAQSTSKNGISIVLMPLIDVSNTVTPVQVSRMHTVQEVVIIFKKLCLALGELHHEGLIHRDIKPGNILMVREKDVSNPADTIVRPIITDFGLASIPEYTAYSISNTLKGTPRYLPPEQGIDSKRAKPQSDMYSLALLGYELLTGETYSPPNEQLPSLINRIWALSRGKVFHKPTAPSAYKYNIVENQLGRIKFNGFTKFFKKRKEKKRLYKILADLEKILARMIITQDASRVISECSRMPNYKEKYKTQGRLEYADLKETEGLGHKEAFINKMVELRYSTMEEAVKDLHRIENELPPETQDYRKMIFTNVRTPKAHPIMWTVGIGAVIAAGILGYLGKFDSFFSFIKNLFN